MWLICSISLDSPTDFVFTAFSCSFYILWVKEILQVQRYFISINIINGGWIINSFLKLII